MTDAGPDVDDDEDVEDVLQLFGARLAAYAAELDERDRRLLDVVLFRAMAPLDRLRLLQGAGALSAEERALLDELAGEEELS